jgi:parvulin-like peptidyl-prolyl isomerase
VDEERVSFNVAGWKSKRTRSKRTRRDALLLAQRLADEARDKGNFDVLARQFSEDPETAVRGGSLGGLVAGHLAAWPQVLDAVATLRVGDVSDPVETEYGYHVLYRRPEARQDTVSGSHIVIGHVDAPWLQLAARTGKPTRSRDDALHIATDIYERVRQQPSRFAELALKYSEHRDAVRGGDFGAWSTREPTGYPREIETLTQLEVGGIAEPIDSTFGYQVIQRTENRPRKEYAMTKVQLRFDSSRPALDAYSKPKMFEKAREMAALLQRQPADFAALQERWCCKEVWHVIEGRDVPALEAALESLAPGQIAAQPVEDVDVEFMIPKRLELNQLPGPPQVLFELPGSELPVCPPSAASCR